MKVFIEYQYKSIKKTAEVIATSAVFRPRRDFEDQYNQIMFSLVKNTFL